MICEVVGIPWQRELREFEAIPRLEAHLEEKNALKVPSSLKD